MSSAFHTMPLWLLFAATLAITFLAVEIGFRAGLYRARRSEDERHAAIDAMVGSTLGLLAFVLAFTFGMAASRYEERGDLMRDDVIAIRTADMRAQQLPEPHRAEIRALLRQYVDIRVEGTLVPGAFPRALVRSDELHDRLWSRAAALDREPAFAQALIEMMHLHTKRVTAVVQNAIPGTIWLALYCVTIIAMAITGYRTGVAGRRSVVATLTVALAFSVVIVIVADLDRPRDGLLQISQQGMLDLQARLHRP